MEDDNCDNKHILLFVLIFMAPFTLVSLRMYQAGYINSLPQKLCHVNSDAVLIYQRNAFSTGFKIGHMLVTDIYDFKIVIANRSTFIYPSSEYITVNFKRDITDAANDIKTNGNFVCHYDKAYNICFDGPPNTGALILIIWIPCLISLMILSCCAYENYKKYIISSQGYVSVHQNMQDDEFGL